MVTAMTKQSKDKASAKTFYRCLKTDLFHSILGFISGIYPPAGIIILIIFIIYETLDKEKITETIGDFLEYLLGFVLGHLLLHFLAK